MPELSGDWRLIREEVLDGARAMAYDEVAAEIAAAGGPRTVRVYQWLPGTLSLGYNQPPETVAWTSCDERGVDVVRRPTGGGGIYHDTHGDISYSIVAPAGEVPGDLMETYELFCEPLFEAFAELGVDARFVAEKQPALYEPACYLRPLHPAHDIVAGDGRKISGNAQYRRKDAVVQHGSITYEVFAEEHLDCFADPGVSPDEFRERVCGIAEVASDLLEQDLDRDDVGPMDSFDYGREHAVRVLEDALAEWAGAEEGAWTEQEQERAEEIAGEKYRSDAWTVDREEPLG
jgi:lipoate-protein ligase A